MLIPVFTIYAPNLMDATPALIGIALGSYGLSQGLLQIPMGLLSDRFGRKPILAVGLSLFVAGSLLGGVTNSIYGMIAARILQGMGAIGSVLIALMADLTPDEHRTKAMAVIGATIGLSFSIAMVISPTMTHYFGLSGIFYLTAILACFGLILVFGVVPTPVKEPFHLDSEVSPALLKPALKNPHLLRLNAGIFCQHFILTSTFFAIPILLQQQIEAGLLEKSWHFYLPLMVFSFLAMVPFIILAERKRMIKPIFVAAVLVIALCQTLLTVTYSYWLSICLLLFFYFIAFNFLEASLPSLVSRQASAASKGTAMGIYSSCQFLGIFAGGALAGFVYQSLNSRGLFAVNALISFLWLAIASFMNPYLYFSTLIIKSPKTDESEAIIQSKLLAIPGVVEATFIPEEKNVYLRLNHAEYKPGSVERVIATLSRKAR